MMNYTLSDEMRARMAEHPRAIQAAIALAANRELSVTSHEPQGIFKYQGGVLVNGREIAIHRDMVRDDWGHGDDAPTPEETAVVKAIGSVAELISAGSALPPVTDNMRGDPLRAMLGMM